MNSNKIAILSDAIISKFRQVEIELFKIIPSQLEITKWLKQIRQHIRLCNITIRHADLSVGTLRKLQTNLCHLKRLRNILKYSASSKTGMGIINDANRSSRVKWEDVTSSFQSRVERVVSLIKHTKTLFHF